MTNKPQPVIWNEYVKENSGEDINVSMFYKIGEPGLFCNISITEMVNSSIIHPLLQAIEEKIQNNKKEFEALPESEKTTMGKGFSLAFYSVGLNQLLKAITKEKDRVNMLVRKLADAENIVPVKHDS
jgi:hypothetical protein